MKKVLPIICLACCISITSCYDEQLEEINDRIDKVEQLNGNKIATIQQQVDAINETLPKLQATDQELKDYITILEGSATKFEEEIASIEQKITEAEEAIGKAVQDIKSVSDSTQANKGYIEQLISSHTELVENLETAKSDLKDELKLINDALAQLKDKETYINGQITDLKNYIDKEILDQEDWIVTSFATLRQYAALANEIAAIKENINVINTSITSLQETLTEVISQEIAKVMTDLGADIQGKITEVTSSYTTAIEQAKTAITEAYTTEIASAIGGLETSIQSWVNSKLSGYCTISAVDAKLEVLSNSCASKESIQAEVNTLKSDLEQAKALLTEEYEKAITEAISNNNGVIDGEIAAAVEDINKKIDNQIAAINSKITIIEQRLDRVEGEVATLKEQLEVVNNTLETLEEMDTEIQTYITALEGAAQGLEKSIEDTDKEIEDLKKSLEDSEKEMEDLKNAITNYDNSALIAELEQLRSDMEAELELINNAIATLQTTFTNKLNEEIQALKGNLDEKILALDNNLQDKVSSIEGTFATLEAFYELSDQVASIQATISSVQESIKALENNLKAKIEQDIANAINPVYSYIESQVATITSGYMDAIEVAYNEITEAYTSKLELELYTMKGLIASINDRFDDYYTISEVNSLIGNLQTNFNNQLESQKAYLMGLISSLDISVNQDIEDNASMIRTLQGIISQIQTKDDLQSSLIDKNASEIAKNTDNIAKNALTISSNADKIANNSGKIDHNTELIEENNQLIADNKALIEANDAAIKTLAIHVDATTNDLLTKISANTGNIANNADLIAMNAAAISNNAAAIIQNASDIQKVQQDLTVAKAQIKSEYEALIHESITTLNGSISSEMDVRIAAINATVESKVSEINTVIAAIEARITAVEKEIKNIKIAIYAIQEEIAEIQENIAALIARIQSVTFVPTFADGRATMMYTNSSGTITPGSATLKYEIRPAAVAEELAAVWEDALSVGAVYTMTRSAGDIVTLDIESVSASGGILTLIVSGSNLSQEYFRSEISANIRLEISNGYNSITSAYTNMVPWTTNVVYIPDANFKILLLEEFDENSDGEISLDEAENITDLSFPASLLKVKSMTGIEYLTNLKTLDFSYNLVTSLDLSNNTKLTDVNISSNKLTSLTLPASVVNVDASNNLLTNLDVSTLTELTDLNVNKNKLVSLFVEKNKLLTSLDCANNSIASLDLSKLVYLTSLSCGGNDLTSLNLSKNTQLATLDCSDNALTQLDLTKNTLLEDVNCSKNSLTMLYVTGSNVKTFNCSDNSLSTLNMLQMTNIESFDCSGNSLSQLNVNPCIKLKEFDCSDNNLSSLNISSNQMLTNLDCSGNSALERIWVKDETQGSANITKDDHTLIFVKSDNVIIPDAALRQYLVANYDDDNDGEISVEESYNITMVNCSNKGVADLTGLEACAKLVTLTCSNNNIKTIDLPNLYELRTVTCDGNPVEKINLDNCSALQYLNLQGVTTNAISGTTISIDNYTQAKTFDISVKGTPFRTFKFRNDPDLTAIVFLGEFTTVDLYGCSILDGIDVSTLTDLKSLDVQKCKLQSLDVTHNPALTMLAFSDNKLTGIDLSNNTSLVKLYCNQNLLSKINLTTNTRLQELDIAGNKLSALNIRNNTALKYLKVSNNTALSMVDVAYNTALEILLACEIAMTDIDLSNNTALKGVSLLSPNLTSVIGKTSKAGEGIEYIEKTPYIKGAMMSIGETETNWTTGSSWAKSYGTGWNLPTRAQCTDISSRSSSLNTVLGKYGKTTLKVSSSYTYYYWTCEESSTSTSYGYNFYSNYNGNFSINSSLYCRAVLTY